MTFNKIRVYINPKGYKDFICSSVSMRTTSSGYNAVVIGGANDGQEIKNVRGASVIDEVNGTQRRLL